MEAEKVILEEVDNWLNDFIDKVFAKSQDNLVADGKIDTGNLLKSGSVQKKFLEKDIEYTAPYADSVEFGRTAGTPMYSGWLHDWVRRKLGVNDDKEVKSISFSIAKSIKQRGIKPSPYLLPALYSTLAEEKISLQKVET